MLEKTTLLHFIKTKIWQDVEIGTNLLGEPIIEKQLMPTAFRLIQEFCSTNKIPNSVMVDVICKYNNKELLKQALEETRDVQSYGKAWIKAENGYNYVNYLYLKKLGATEGTITEIKMSQEINVSNNTQPPTINMFTSEEDIVKFYLLGDKNRLWRFIKSKHVTPIIKHSMIADAFGKAGIFLTKYINNFEFIENPKILADVMWCVLGEPAKRTDKLTNKPQLQFKLTEQQTTAGLDMLALYLSKFDDVSNIEDYLDVVFEGLGKYNYNGRKLKAFNGKSANELLDDSLNKFYNALINSKINIKKKISLVINNSFKDIHKTMEINLKKLPKTKRDISWHAETLAKEYSSWLGRQTGITTKNVTSYNVLGYIDYYILSILNNNVNDANHAFKAGIIDYCLDLPDKGYLQEYSKFLFCNNSSPLRTYLCRKDRYSNYDEYELDEIKDKYQETESYKKIPVPFEYIWQKEVASKYYPKYPYFIIARNAEKQPGFVPEILAEPLFWQDGFRGTLFKTENAKWQEKVQEDTVIFSNYPPALDLNMLYKLSVKRTPAQQARLEYEQKYFGNSFEDELEILQNYINWAISVDDSQQADAFLQSVQMNEDSWQSNPLDAQAEEDTYLDLMNIDVDSLTIPEPPLNCYGEEIDEDDEYLDCMDDDDWRDEIDNVVKEKLLEKEWQEFNCILTGKIYKEPDDEIDDEEDLSQEESDDYEELLKANMQVSLLSYLTQKLKENGEDEDDLLAELEYRCVDKEDIENGTEFYNNTLIEIASVYVEEETDAFSDDELEERHYQLQEDMGNYCTEENEYYSAYNPETEDAEDYYEGLDEEIEQQIEDGEYEEIDLHLQQLISNPPMFD